MYLYMYTHVTCNEYKTDFCRSTNVHRNNVVSFGLKSFLTLMGRAENQFFVIFIERYLF